MASGECSTNLDNVYDLFPTNSTNNNAGVKPLKGLKANSESTVDPCYEDRTKLITQPFVGDKASPL